MKLKNVGKQDLILGGWWIMKDGKEERMQSPLTMPVGEEVEVCEERYKRNRMDELIASGRVVQCDKPAPKAAAPAVVPAPSPKLDKKAQEEAEILALLKAEETASKKS